jgi:alpha-1,6-mannosyltransferase
MFAGSLRTAGRTMRVLTQGEIALIAAGIALEAALLAFWALSDVWRGSPWLIPAFMLPIAVYLATVFGLPRLTRSEPSTRRSMAIVLLFAALYHVTFLLTPHPLSNDLYRYAWDGLVLSRGINPYAYPPAAPELAGLRNDLWGLIFNPDISTGYPPLIETIFAGIHRLGAGPIGYRVFAALCSLGTCIALPGVLRALGIDERRAIIYAWSPLVALEFANSGHLDAAAILCLVLAFRAQIEERFTWSALLLAGGGLIKFFPAILAPVWGKRWDARAWLVFAAALVLPWLPFLPGGTPFSGLAVFGQRGEFNAGLYTVIQAGLGTVLYPGAARLVARLLAAGIVGVVGLVLARRAWAAADPRAEWRFAAGVMAAVLIVSPVVHPWYVCWMLAFICIEWQPAWLILSGSVMAARHVYLGYEATGMWQETRAMRWLVWVPFYATLIVQQGIAFIHGRRPREDHREAYRRPPLTESRVFIMKHEAAE